MMFQLFISGQLIILQLKFLSSFSIIILLIVSRSQLPMNIIRNIYSSAIGFIDHCLKYNPSKAKSASSKSQMEKIHRNKLSRSKRSVKRKVRHHYLSQSESSLDQSSRYFETSFKNRKRKRIAKDAGRPKNKKIKRVSSDRDNNNRGQILTSSIYRFEDGDGISISSISPKSQSPEFLNQSLLRELAPLMELESPQKVQQNKQQHKSQFIFSLDSSLFREEMISQESEKPHPQSRNLAKQNYPMGRLIIKRKNSIDSSSSYEYIIEEFAHNPKGPKEKNMINRKK